MVYNAPDLDMAWNNLKKILSETINRHASLINKRIKGKPDVKAAMNIRDKLYRKISKVEIEQ